MPGLRTSGQPHWTNSNGATRFCEFRASKDGYFQLPSRGVKSPNLSQVHQRGRADRLKDNLASFLEIR
jgi:hypothetical protein